MGASLRNSQQVPRYALVSGQIPQVIESLKLPPAYITRDYLVVFWRPIAMRGNAIR